MIFTVFCYGDGDFLFHIFNAVAAMVNHDDFHYALMVVVSYVSLYVLVVALFQGYVFDFKWFFAVLMIYRLLLMPKAQVSIEDRFQGGGWGGASQVHIVAHVPIGLAFLVSATSKLGDWLCLTMETVFSLPDGLRYQDHGPLFGNALVSAMNNYSISNENTQEALANFWHDCVFYDLVLGFYTLQDMGAAADLENFFSAHAASNRGFIYISQQGQSQYLACNQAFSGYLQSDLAAEISQSAPQLVWHAQADLSRTMIQSSITAMPIAFAYLTSLSLSASTVLTQAALMNSMTQGFSSFNNPQQVGVALNAYVQARAEQQREMDYGVLGKISAKALPVLRNLVQAFLIAIFPLVAMLSLGHMGYRAWSAYGRALLWISLWPPIYAVLNFGVMFFSSIAAQKTLTACSLGACTVAYTLSSSSGLGAVLHLYSSLAGYLMTSIPMIAWLLVQQSGAMMSQLAARVVQGYTQPVAGAAADASQGNFSQGQVHFDDSVAWNHSNSPRNSAGYIWADDGNYVTTHASMGDTVQQTSSKMALGVQMKEALQTSYARAQADLKAQAQSSDAVVMHDRAMAWKQISALSSASSLTHGIRDESRESRSQTADLEQSHLDQALRTYAKSHAYQVDDSKTLSYDLKASLDAVYLEGSTNYDKHWTKLSSDRQDLIKNFVHSDAYVQAVRLDMARVSSHGDMHETKQTAQALQGAEHYLQKSEHEEQSYRQISRQERQLSESMTWLHQIQASDVVDFENALVQKLEASGIDWQQGLHDLSVAEQTELARQVLHVADDLILALRASASVQGHDGP